MPSRRWPSTDLSPPRLAARPPVFPERDRSIDVPAVEAPPGKSIALAVSVPLPKGFKLNEEAPVTYLVETPEKEGILSPSSAVRRQKIKPAEDSVQDHRPTGQSRRSRRKAGPASLAPDVCLQRDSSLCRIRSFIWNIPITWSAGGSTEPVSLTDEKK